MSSWHDKADRPADEHRVTIAATVTKRGEKCGRGQTFIVTGDGLDNPLTATNQADLRRQLCGVATRLLPSETPNTGPSAGVMSKMILQNREFIDAPDLGTVHFKAVLTFDGSSRWGLDRIGGD